MAYIGKTYVEVRSENLEALVKSLKIPDNVADRIVNSKHKQKLEKNGDDYVLTSHLNEMPMVVSFKSGVEFDENVGPKGQERQAKTTFTVDGNKVTQVQKFSDGNIITLVREYGSDKLEMTITTSSWSGTAKRYYVAE
ncbi:fatty acid-binding protein 2-like [Zerene cesonia]|uniref:fatty acid-binding protein 2-like n=1 Tax=Zerene cesonia TaxID=33412 RepID=UPI0018E5773A|nr:fatty acid-binding protein 2-like [Zerene cesonia]